MRCVRNLSPLAKSLAFVDDLSQTVLEVFSWETLIPSVNDGARLGVIGSS